MPFELQEHTADLALDIVGDDLKELFVDALRGLTDCITDVEGVESREAREIELEADDLEQLFVEWLGEAVYLFDAEDMIFAEAEAEIFEEPGTWRLTGVFRGEPFDPDRHEARIPVKGVTYHRLEVRRDDDGWRASVVLDI